jgi:hypothetical protein
MPPELLHDTWKSGPPVLPRSQPAPARFVKTRTQFELNEYPKMFHLWSKRQFPDGLVPKPSPNQVALESRMLALGRKQASICQTNG